MKVGFRPSEGDDRFQDALAEVTYAEELGFDSAWVAEHHGWDLLWPTSHIALAGFATRTDEIELGTSVTLLPQTNPVRLAGEANLLDQITQGRFRLGVGAGWREDEMENLGYEFDTRGPRMTDHLRAMQALWAGEDYEGEWVSFEGFDLSPDPVQDPHPPVWVGGGVDPALKRAARLGDAWFPVWLEGIDELRPMYDQYDEYVREEGEDPGDRERPMLRVAWVDEDGDRARRRLREFFETLIQNYRDRGSPIPDALLAGMEQDFESFADGRFVYGTPAECAADLERFEEELGVDHVVLKLFNPGVDHDQMMTFLELLGDDVLSNI